MFFCLEDEETYTPTAVLVVLTFVVMCYVVDMLLLLHVSHFNSCLSKFVSVIPCMHFSISAINGLIF